MSRGHGGSRPRSRRLGRRTKIWIAVVGSVVGTAAVTALAVWIDTSRETDLADPTAGVTTRLSHDAPPDAPSVTFTDVSADVGVTAIHGRGPRTRRLPEDTGSGLAWGDVDGDGDPDLFVVDFPSTDPADPSPGNRLYRNDAGVFVDITDSAGVADVDGFGMGASFADYDGDGDADLYVTNHGPNRLFRNDGTGRFEEVAGAAGVDSAAWSVGVSWADPDRDGDLDLYVCNYLRYHDLPDSSGGGGDAWNAVPLGLNPHAFEPVANHLYLNRGDGTFEDAAARLGVDDPRGRSLGAVFCDLDGDGLMDLYVNNDASPNALFVGRRGADDTFGFEDVSARTGTADPRGSMGLSIADVTSRAGPADGLPDLFITHWIAQENALYAAQLSRAGQLQFRDKTRRVRLGEISTGEVGWGCAFEDIDLDGRVDILVANGSTLEDEADRSHLVAERMFVFWNAGDRFWDLAGRAGDAALPQGARGLACADFDGDGDADVAICVNRGRVRLLRNDSRDRGAALRVVLDAPDTARFGARVEVETAAGRQVRWAGCDVSYASMHATDLIFGLGTATSASAVRVLWADGERSELTDVQAGSARLVHPSRD